MARIAKRCHGVAMIRVIGLAGVEICLMVANNDSCHVVAGNNSCNVVARP